MHILVHTLYIHMCIALNAMMASGAGAVSPLGCSRAAGVGTDGCTNNYSQVITVTLRPIARPLIILTFSSSTTIS